MNTYYFDKLKNDNLLLFNNFINANSGKANLKIRAYAANEALPISNLHVIVSTNYDDNKIVFFDGETDNSGMIDTLSLPVPILDNDDLNVPNSILYDIEAIDSSYHADKVFQVRMYDNICVVQNIMIVPEVDSSGN